MKREFTTKFNDEKKQKTMDEIISEAHKTIIANQEILDKNYKIYHINRIAISKSHTKRLSE